MLCYVFWSQVEYGIVCFIYVGEAQHSEEATWGLSSTSYYYDYDYTKNDLRIENEESVKLIGVTMPTLSKSPFVNVNNLNGLLIWVVST